MLRTFEIRVDRFAGAGSEVVTVEAVNRASAWSKAAALVDDPNNIWRMEMLADNGRRLRVGLYLPDGDPDFYGGVPVDEAAEQDHAPQVFAEPWLPGDVRGIDHDTRLYVFWFKMFTEAEAEADAGAYARNRTEAWSIAAFAEAVGQISALELSFVGATKVGYRPDWAGYPSDKMMWGGEQQDTDRDLPYGGVIADLSARETAVDWDSIARMRQPREDAERLEFKRLFGQTARLVAIVVGDSSGIGRVVAELLAHEGVRVAIVGPRQADLERVAAEIAAATGVEVLPVAAEVGNSEQVRAMAQRVRDHFGKVDIVANVSIEGIEDDPDLETSVRQRTIELYGLPPHTPFGTRWLDGRDHEQLGHLLPGRMRADLLLAVDGGFIMNFIRRS